MLLFSCERILPGGLIALTSIYPACVLVLKKLVAFVLPSFSSPSINIILVTGVVGDCAVLLLYCSSWEKSLSPPQIIIKDSLLAKYLPKLLYSSSSKSNSTYLYFVSLSFLLRHLMCHFMFKFSGCVINLIYEIVYLAIHTKSCLMYDVLKKD